MGTLEVTKIADEIYLRMTDMTLDLLTIYEKMLWNL